MRTRKGRTNTAENYLNNRHKREIPKKKKKKMETSEIKRRNVGSSETQYLTERDRDTAKGRRRKGTKEMRVEGREKRGNSCKEKRE